MRKLQLWFPGSHSLRTASPTQRPLALSTIAKSSRSSASFRVAYHSAASRSSSGRAGGRLVVDAAGEDAHVRIAQRRQQGGSVRVDERAQDRALADERGLASEIRNLRHRRTVIILPPGRQLSSNPSARLTMQLRLARLRLI